ncbi:hypothetical protein HDU82_004519 [Entophlyctis luteolus]|nr:hypothetical protein HDU82_004519 [Entophlyctis luteolus]
MADGAGIYRYMTESLRISKALEAFLAARHASEVQYATALAEACYTLRENVESKVETEGRLQNSPLKPAVSDLVKGTGKIADARYGFASMMKKRVLDVFAAVNVDLEVYLESETALRMQDYMIETVEILRKDKAAYHKNREALCEVQELVAKVQEDSPQKRREFDRLTQKLTQSVQKMVQLNCTVQESQDQYDAARSDYINTALPKFQNDLVRWTETRTNSIKDMLIQLKQLEQIAVEKAEEAVNVGKDSANAIDTQESVSQFMNAAQLSLDLAVRKSSAISIRDMKMFSKAGKLYVKRSKSPLSPWCIQYSVLQENRLVLFDGPESEHPREVILLDKIPKVIATLGSAKGQQKFENDLFWHTIVNEVQYSLFQKADCFQLIFHENASVIPISLEPKVDLSDSCSISAFQENHGALEISTEPRTNGGDRSYYFIPVDPEPSKHWIKAFVENGARSCQCGKCYEHKAKLALRIWIIEGTSIGVERGTNDNLSVTIKFGKLNMAKTLFKQGPNPVWNEEFRFDSLPSCTDSISFSVKSSLNLDNGDLDIGNICNKIDEMSLERRIESTVCFLCFPASSIKLAYLLTIHEHLGLESYKGLIESLVTPPLNAFHLFSDVLNHDNKDEFCDYYLNLLLANPPALLPALSCLTDREIRETEDPNILFRGNSTLTKILDRFMRIRGEEYVKIVLSDCIKDIYESNSKLEIDPNKITAAEGEDLLTILTENKLQLLAQTTGIWNAIQSSSEHCPLFVIRRLEKALILQSEKLRQFLHPQRYGLIAHDPDVATVRKLTLITKIMQHLANFSPFGVKERHMECSNDWIASNTDAMKAFLDKISSSDINSDLSAKLEVNAPDQLSTITCVHKFLSGCAPSITSTTPGILSNETWQYNMRMVDSLDLDLEAKARKGLKLLRAMTAESKQINSNIRRTIDFPKKLDHFNHSFEKKQTEFFNASQSIPNRRKEKTKHSPIRRKSRSLESFATVTRPLSLYGIQTLVKAQMDALMNPNSKATDFEIGTSSGDDSSKNAISSPDQYRQRMTKFINSVPSATLTVATTGGNSSSPLLYGLMFEDINNSGDGGIHGQLLRNNGFQGSSQSLLAYAAVGSGVTLSVDSSTPLSSAITHTLQVSVASGTTGFVGFSNEGYLGVPVNADTYSNYFWMKGAYSGTITLELVGNYSGIVYASKNITVSSTSSSFTYVNTSYASTQSPDGSNVWRLKFDASKVAGKSLWFSLVQLFPSTYHGRPNGLRLDVGNFLAEMKPTFLRFPGGETVDTRWKWNETIGPLQNRPGRQGDWGYGNTDALGLMEYLQWCEDMNLAPVLAIWAGYSLGGTSVTGSALTPYVNDALDELEFLLGPVSSTLGALRATYGHPAPYNITMVEIGNEDFIPCSTYATRFTAFYNAISAAYPNLIIIASTADSSCAVSEAVYMIGLERNSDIVKMACYAPMFEHFDMAEWSPDLAGLDSRPGSLTGSVSYYVQKMFANSKGDTILPVSSTANFGPLYWVASSTTAGTYYVKLANYGTTTYNVTVEIPTAVNVQSVASLEILTGSATESNYPLSVSVVPVSSTVTGSPASGWSFSLPGYGVGVLTVNSN